MIQVDQNELILLLRNKILALGGKEKSGTYNAADPTAWCQWTGKIGVMYGYETYGDGYPGPAELLDVEVKDICWGTYVNIETSQGVESAYLDTQTQEWSRPTENFFKVFKDVLLHGVSEEEITAIMEDPR